jgi:hypothetical protein
MEHSNRNFVAAPDAAYAFRSRWEWSIERLGLIVADGVICHRWDVIDTAICLLCDRETAIAEDIDNRGI